MWRILILVVASGMLATTPRHAMAQQAQVLCERVLPSPRGLGPFALRVVSAPSGEYVALGQAGLDYGPPAPGGGPYYVAATHLYLARLTSSCDTVWQRWTPHLADYREPTGLAVDRHGIWALMSDTVYNYYTQRQRSRARLWQFTPTGRLRRSVVLPPRSYPEYPVAALPAAGGGCYVSTAGPLGSTFPLTNYTVPSLLRFDSTGAQVWRRNYPGVPGDARLNVLAPSLRGTLLLAGTAIRTAALDYTPKLIEIETSRGDSVGGAFLSSPTGPVSEFMSASNQEPFDLLPLTRGRGYALTTEIEPYNGTTPPLTGAVVRLDANYRVLWRYQYPNSPQNNHVSFTQVRELADGSLLALARPRTWQRQCWLYRLDGATGALLGAYPVAQGVGGQRAVKVNYLLPVAADSTLMLMGQVYDGAGLAAGLYVARVRIPNLPRIVTGTAGSSAPATTSASAWQVYPNPAAGAATLWLPAPLLRQASVLTLYNALGQRVHGQTMPVAVHEMRVSLNLAGLPSGVYSVQLTTTDGTTVKRLVVE